MHSVIRALIAFVAVEHIGFMVLEMFFWTEPLGLRVFGRTPQQAMDSASLAANQGLYNGFLAAGLIWGLFFISSPEQARRTQVFFLVCVVIAGIFGAVTAKGSILFVQALPAALALVLLFLGPKPHDLGAR